MQTKRYQEKAPERYQNPSEEEQNRKRQYYLMSSS